jgi:hypothetical protein
MRSDLGPGAGKSEDGMLKDASSTRSMICTPPSRLNSGQSIAEIARELEVNTNDVHTCQQGVAGLRDLDRGTHYWCLAWTGESFLSNHSDKNVGRQPK